MKKEVNYSKTDMKQGLIYKHLKKRYPTEANEYLNLGKFGVNISKDHSCMVMSFHNDFQRGKSYPAINATGLANVDNLAQQIMLSSNAIVATTVDNGIETTASHAVKPTSDKWQVIRVQTFDISYREIENKVVYIVHREEEL